MAGNTNFSAIINKLANANPSKWTLWSKIFSKYVVYFYSNLLLFYDEFRSKNSNCSHQSFSYLAQYLTFLTFLIQQCFENKTNFTFTCGNSPLSMWDDRVLVTAKNLEVNSVLPIWLMVELPNFPNTSRKSSSQGILN